jgi:DNA-binding IclR family transcriptional regulator
VTDTAPIRLGDRLVAIVESFVSAPSQTLSDVSAACGMEPSTTIRYLKQLVEHGWLERDEDTRRYSLGVRLVAIGQSARSARPLRQRLIPHMQDLVSRFDETVNLAVHQADEVVVIEALESGRSIRRGASVGERDEWFVSSLGKAILANLPEDEVRRLYTTQPPTPRTENTLVTLDAVLADLALIRRRGYALDNEEAEIGLKCAGIAIRDQRGRYSHAISISGPTARIDQRLDEIIDALTRLSSLASDGQKEAV